MSVLGKRRQPNSNEPNLNEIIREIETNNNPGEYALSLVSTFFDERKALPIAHTFLLRMLHHIVTLPLSDTTLDNFISFLMAWEEYPYYTTVVLPPKSDQYKRYREDLLMFYTIDEKIPDTIKKVTGLELSNSSIMHVIQDSKAKQCPYGAACTRTNPTHISLMHPQGHVPSIVPSMPGFKRKKRGGTLRKKKAQRKANRTARRRHSPM